MTLLLALFQPERPYNLGAALRLAACMGVPVAVIEPCGFPLDDRRIRIAALDYGGLADWRRHADWPSFLAHCRMEERRLCLLSTQGGAAYHRVTYRRGDVLLVGRESRGVPESVFEAADVTVRVPMAAGRRSLNLVAAGTLVLGEALRQLGALDALDSGEPLA